MYAELIGAISNFMYGKLLIIMLIGVGLYYTFLHLPHQIYSAASFSGNPAGYYGEKS